MGNSRREDFIAAAQATARDLAEPELADFTNAWLFGNVNAIDEMPDRFINEVSTRVFGID